MIRYIFGFLLVIRNSFQNAAAKMLNRFRDPKTGKFSKISPRTLSMLIWTTGIIFFFLIISSRIISNKARYSGGADEFQKEMTPKLGGNLFPPEFDLKEDKLNEEIDKILQEEKKSDSSDRPTIEGKRDSDSLTKEECDLILDKMKIGQSLSQTDKEQMNVCLEKNISNLSAEELEFAKALMRDDLSDEERELLQKALSGTASAEELALARGLSSSDPAIRDAARAAVKDPELREAFMKKMNEQSGKEVKDKANLVDTKELSALAEKIGKSTGELNDLKEKLANAQAAAVKAGEKLAKGLMLSKDDQNSLAKVSDTQKEINKKSSEIAADKALLQEKSKSLKNTLTDIESKLDENMPSSFGEEFEEDVFSVDEKGNPISPEKIKLMAIRRKKMIELQIKREKEGQKEGQLDSSISSEKNGQSGSDVSQTEKAVENRVGESESSKTGLDVITKEDQLAIANTLIEDEGSLSKEEKEILAKALNGKLNEKETPIVKALIDENEALRELARKALKDAELKEALAKALLEQQLSEKEKELLEKAFGKDIEDQIKSLLEAKAKKREKDKNKAKSDAERANLVNDIVKKIRKEFNKAQGVGSDAGEGSSFVGEAESVSAKDVFAQMGQAGQTDLNQLVVFSDKSLKPFSLSPDMKVPAMLATTILISDKGRPQVVRVKTLSDVFEPESNKLVIPKGSIIVGTTSGFDADTGIMDLTFDKVSVGSGKVLAASFSVGSADGTFGLKGEVRDTRGKLLLGAFISSFSAGAMNWFSQSIIQPFAQSTVGTDAILGAGLGGAAEVAQKIADLYAGDLQNSARIFYVPKNVPIILYPQ